MDEDLLLGLCSPLTRGLDWDTSFTSTVDVDAIKVNLLEIALEFKDEMQRICMFVRTNSMIALEKIICNGIILKVYIRFKEYAISNTMKV